MELSNSPPRRNLGIEPQTNSARLRPSDIWLMWILPALLFVILESLSIGLWRAEVRLDQSAPGRAPQMILWGGLGVSLAMSVAVALICRHRRNEEHQGEHHLAALESLAAITTAVSAQIYSRQQVLTELVEAARGLMGMEMSMILALDAEKKMFHRLAHGGQFPGAPPETCDVDRLPACKESLERGKPIFIENTERETRPINRDIATRYHVGSLIVMPLVVAHEQIGVLTMSCSRPRKFTASDRRLADLLGAQAAVIIVNSRLLEQTRRDAEVKAVLLRELNHRVKNNMAGIVALLSLDTPEMLPQTRRWLDRVTDRIRVMAGAHELFAAGEATTDLAGLVEKVMPTLSVVRPPSVKVQTQIDANAILDAEQAVSLAMVLHELCYNAIAHGMPQGGTLTIRAKMIANQRIAIDVVDTGGAHGSVEESRGTGTGFGLRLVGELVARELQGSFSLQRNNGDGATASIEFPVVVRDEQDLGTAIPQTLH